MLNLVCSDLVVDRVDVDKREEGGQRDQQWHLNLKIIHRSVQKLHQFPTPGNDKITQINIFQEQCLPQCM